MNQSLPVLTDLSKVFPDIQDQLCSRHSILMGKLKNTYAKIYDHYEPAHYTVVKGVLDVFDQNEVTLSMGLQNGMILLSRQIDTGQPIYINSNHFDSELIFTSQGQVEEGFNEYVNDIGIAIEAANEGLPNEQRHGGIFYIHANLVENNFSYGPVMLLSIFIGVSLINNTLSSLTVEQLIKKLAKYKVFGEEAFLRKLFMFQNRQFTLTVGGQQFKVNLQKQNKLVLCQLDLAKRDVNFQIERRRQLQDRKAQLFKQLQANKGISTFLQLLQTQQQVDLSTPFRGQIQHQDQIMNAQNFIGVGLKELGLLSQFNSQNITFEQLVSALWELNSQYWKIHSDEVVELVDQIKQNLKINSCMIIHNTYALIVTDKNKYAELLIFLRQKQNKGELKSKSLFKIQEDQLIQHRWSSDKRIGEKLFTSVPSAGVGVFDPSQAIWFD